MATFIVVHELPAEASQAELLEMGARLANSRGGDVRWRRGWIVPERDCFLSEWEAEEEATVRLLLNAAPLFPVKSIYEVTAVEPAWFRDEPQGLARPVRIA
jgi:hypothetical protein